MSLKVYLHKADSNFWEHSWENALGGMSLSDYYLNSDKNLLIKKDFFQKYLPKDGKIIEAGCGLGVWVYLLERMGYNIEGVDFAEETINFIKTKFPTLPVRKGNILSLEYPNNYFSGYISIGVVEHFEEGPSRALREASRVLNEKGVMILSVPYANIFRRIKNFFRTHKEKKGEFYQYFYNGKEIKDYIKKAGFKVIETYPYNSAKCLKDEFLKKKKQFGGGGNVTHSNKRISISIIRIIINSFILRRIFAHSIIVVAKKYD